MARCNGSAVERTPHAVVPAASCPLVQKRFADFADVTDAEECRRDTQCACMACAFVEAYPIDDNATGWSARHNKRGTLYVCGSTVAAAAYVCACAPQASAARPALTEQLSLLGLAWSLLSAETALDARTKPSGSSTWPPRRDLSRPVHDLA